MRIRSPWGRIAGLFFVVACLPALAGAQEAPEEFMALIEGAQEGAGEEDLGRFTLGELMEEFGVPGLSVAVIWDHRIHWAEGYGIRDVETGEPVDTETMFQAASMSKPVAAMGTMKAVQDGLFGLDDDINTVLTSWRLEGGELTRHQPVTPRMLTSHTSGLGDAFGFPGYEPDAPIPTPVQVLDGHELSNVRKVFMEREPMEAYEYSGGGVTVQQQALEDARGMPFEAVMQRDVLGPLGMTRSSFVQPLSPEHDRNAARAHDNEGQSMGPKWHVYPEMAAAGLWTTASDLARFLIEVQLAVRGESERVLDRAHAREMITPVGVGDFAVGFSLDKDGEGWYFGHGGSNWGFRSNMRAHTVKGYGWVVMTNANRGGPVMGEIADRIERHYRFDSKADPVPRGYAPPVQREAIELTAEQLDEYVGVYEVRAEMTIEFTREGTQLYATPTGQERLTVFAEAVDRLFLRVADVVFEFHRNEEGAITGFTLFQGGRTSTARKVR